MLSCRDVSKIVSSDEMNELGRMKRMELRLHLMLCRHCKRYADQMRAIGEAMRQIWRSRQVEHESLERLERKILAGVSAAGGPSTQDSPLSGPDHPLCD
jgi:hypothetical protein